LDNLRNSPLESAVVRTLNNHFIYRRLSQREVERELRLGHGTIGNILRGRTTVRIHHLEILGPVLGLTPDQIVREALGHSEHPQASAVDDVLATKIASQVVDELLQRTTALDPLLLTTTLQDR